MVFTKDQAMDQPGVPCAPISTPKGDTRTRGSSETPQGLGHGMYRMSTPRSFRTVLSRSQCRRECGGPQRLLLARYVTWSPKWPCLGSRSLSSHLYLEAVASAFRISLPVFNVYTDHDFLFGVSCQIPNSTSMFSLSGFHARFLKVLSMLSLSGFHARV